MIPQNINCNKRLVISYLPSLIYKSNITTFLILMIQTNHDRGTKRQQIGAYLLMGFYSQCWIFGPFFTSSRLPLKKVRLAALGSRFTNFFYRLWFPLKRLVKYCSVLTQCYKIDLLIEITFLSKKIIIFLHPFLCNFIRPKTSDKLCVNIDYVYCTHNSPMIMYKKSTNFPTKLQQLCLVRVYDYEILNPTF